MKTQSDNIAYYNAIANEYNNMLNKNPDKVIRKKVADKFCSIAKDGAVLDFGGGTGLDIQWLTDKNFTVFFCEPSTGMRERAISDHSNLPQDNIIFLDDSAVDFRQWHLQLPFPVQVDAVLSNFAVLNCIPDIKLLFQSLALVIKPGADMIALVLTKKLKNKLDGNFRSILKSFIPYGPVTLNITYKKHGQTVYVYSMKEIIKAASKKFNFCSSEILPASDFTLIHLKRK
ncbi:MAG TPA: class I SAM-dependent methyltransferase [Ginsengibacter sp.]